jgi:hypothetical protein
LRLSGYARTFSASVLFTFSTVPLLTLQMAAVMRR